ncbi:MAG: hypothetical protein ACON44_01480 [Candidatus Puniceispirillaceae bacterium]
MRQIAKYVMLVSFVAGIQSASALTFKSDGSVVQSDGTVVRKSSESRYFEALQNFQQGLPVTGFPTAPEKATGLLGLFASDSNPPGYFGSDIVAPGAPLIPLPSVIDSDDPVASIAENLGMSAEQFTSVLVTTSSDEWRAENDIPDTAIDSFVSTTDDFIAAEKETRRLAAEGINAINATTISVEDITSGALDSSFGIETAIVNASPEVTIAYERRLNEVIAQESGLSLDNIKFIQSAVAGAATPAEAAARAAAAQQVYDAANSPQGLAASALIAAEEADRLNAVAERLEAQAQASGSAEAIKAAQDAFAIAEQAAETARRAGETAARAGENAARAATEAVQIDIAAQSGEAARQAALEAGKSAEEAANEAVAASAAASAYESAQNAAIAAGNSANEAAQIAANAAQQAANAANRAANEAAANAALDAAGRAAKNAYDAVIANGGTVEQAQQAGAQAAASAQ